MMARTALQQFDDLINELESAVGSRKPSTSTVEEKKKTTKANTEEKSVKVVQERRVKEVIPVVSEEININSLDLRVGIIRTVIRHETAEKLYCEEIDVGEEVPRPIASGTASI
jgi:aminoacyl tRNA synthase complex-interacting multifunctional protein 1